MIAAFVFIASICATISPNGQAHSQGGGGQLDFQENANCAVIGVAAALRTQGIDVSVADVAAKFPAPYRASNAYVPMKVVSEVLSSFGIPTRVVQFDPKRFSDRHMPALLLIQPDQADTNKGHYILVRASQGPDFEVFDSDNMTSTVRLPRHTFDRIWRGYAVCFGGSAGRSWIEIAGLWTLVVLTGIAAYSLIAHSRSLRAWRRRLAYPV